jgi:hypothetical protein
LAIFGEKPFREYNICLRQGTKIGFSIANIYSLLARLAKPPDMISFAVGASAAAMFQIGPTHLQTTFFNGRLIGKDRQIGQTIISK